MPSTSDLHLDLEERRRLLDDWVEKRRQIAALEAEATDLLIERIALYDADAAESSYHRDAIYRSMIAEYSAASRIPKGSTEYAFTDAHTLALDLPTVRASFAAGRISVGHVREIVKASAIVGEAVRNRHVDADVMTLFETAVLVVAESETAARTRKHARTAASALVGETEAQRHRRSEGERCVTVRSAGDGLAVLTAVLPEWVATAIHDRLTKMAREIIRTRDAREAELEPIDDDLGSLDPRDLSPEDPRYDAYFLANVIFGEDGTYTIDPLAGLQDPLTDPTSPQIEHLSRDSRTTDQIRADLLADLLLASDPSKANGSGLDNVTAHVQVTVAATTLAGEDNRPAELDGHGPLDPDVARGLACRNPGWSRLFLDPTGLVVETDSYTPSAAMRRFLRARDQHCRFPGCRMPVHRCDIDHNHEHAKGGRTRIDNLSHFCRGHHALKHPDIDDRYRWTARQRSDGSITWTSPLGRAYIDHAPRRVMFV